MSKKYTREALDNAVKSSLDSKTAATTFYVPASTIRQHRREPSLNIRAGRRSYLTSEEENHFVALLKVLPDYGFDVTKDVALELATDYFESLSIDVSLNITSPLSSSIPQIFSQITPIQPVLVDGADGPASSGDLHLYSMLQSCPLDLTIDRRPRKRKNLTNSQTTRKLLRLSTEEGKYLYIF
jgi:hypothetical protein